MEIRDRKLTENGLYKEVEKLRGILREKEWEQEERNYAEQLFSRFVKDTFFMSSEEFMQSLVSCIASLLQVRYALISEIVGSGKVRTLSIYANGEFIENFEYDLAGTPCRDVFFNKSLCLYPYNVQKLFPNDHILKQIGVESYVGIPLLSSDEEVQGILIAMNDKAITNEQKTRTLLEIFSVRAAIELDRRKKEHELNMLKNELKKLSMVIEQSVNLVFITDSKGTIEYVNPMFQKVSGYSFGEAIGKKPSILKSGEISLEDYRNLWNTIKSGHTWRGIFKNRKKNGDYYWANNVISPIKNERGEITHFLAIQEDITEKKEAEDRIVHLISHDTLTGLFNRTQFIHLINCWMDEKKTLNSKGALILIDLDHFRFINDTYGHARGDMILNSVASIIEETIQDYYSSVKDPNLKEGHITAHLDSDEFAAFLPGCDEKEGMAAADKIRLAIENLRLLESSARVTASIGIAIYPKHGDTTSEILKRADIAIYKAKDLGKNICRIFSQEDRELEKINDRLEWKDRILSALDEDRFDPWFQPILDLKNDKISHYETLARMRDEEGNILSPAMFIEVAERFKITGLIDKVMIRRAMRLQAQISDEGRVFSISMNLSGRDLGDEGFLDFIKSQIYETGADPRHLIFEITETEAVHNMDKAIKFIKAVKDIGCHFALDDFGVGFSSFLYLKMMQVDYIKIDGTFIRALHENPVDQLFVKSIGNVAREMGIKTIAEFVETTESLDLLREYGIDYAQGYLIGKPAPDFITRPH